MKPQRIDNLTTFRFVAYASVTLLILSIYWQFSIIQGFGKQTFASNNDDLHQAIVSLQTPICGTPTNVSGAIAANTLWTTDNLYILDSTITINPDVTLTIEPGVVIKAKYTTGIDVRGKLLADGTITNPIYFTSFKDDTICGDTNGDGTASIPNAEDWKWIWFESTSDPTSVIRRAEVRYGGLRNYFNTLTRGASIRLNNVMPTLENISFIDNYRNAVEIVGGNWTTSSWDNTTVIYWLNGDTTILAGNTLTISPGVKIKANYTNGVNVNGKLIADGTEAEPIIFSSSNDDTLCGVGAADEPICDTNNNGTASIPNAEDWKWIWFESTSDPTSVIRRAEVRYGGLRNYFNTLTRGASIRLNNIMPTLENISFVDNYRNAVEIVGGNWTTSSWDSTTVIYWLNGDTTILAGNTLTISPGVKVKANYTSGINVNGKLMADGMEIEPIIFSSSNDDALCGAGAANEPICDTNNNGTASIPNAEDWKWIWFESTSDPTSVIRRAEIRYGGLRNYFNTLTRGASIRLNNVMPTLENISFIDNYRNAVEIVEGNWTSSSWNNTTVVHWLRGNTVILAGNMLVVSPGIVIKANSNARLTVNGKANVIGAENNPIFFTSDRDDLVCGVGVYNESLCDTNNDATATVPGINNWSGIHFNADSDDTSAIRYSAVRYSSTGIRLNAASPHIAYTILTNNNRGLELFSQSMPDLICNDIYNNPSYGVFNDTPTVIVSAENHWWGSLLGPTHTSNPGGNGQSVSNGVDFVPWASSPCLASLGSPSHLVFLPAIIK